jgi:hypothetical protein
MSEERRKYPRFPVSEHSALSGGTEGGPHGETLLSISWGGCAFASPAVDLRIAVGQTVRCHFRLEGREELVFAEGKVVYVLSFPLRDQIGRCYGVQFSPEHPEQLAPVMAALESAWRSAGAANASSAHR